MSAHEFVQVLGEEQVAHLAASLEGSRVLQGQCVPKANAAVGGASSRSQQAVLVGRPRNSLHCRRVRAELGLRLHIIMNAPDEKFVVVSTRG